MRIHLSLIVPALMLSAALAAPCSWVVGISTSSFRTARASESGASFDWNARPRTGMAAATHAQQSATRRTRLVDMIVEYSRAAEVSRCEAPQ